ncbi:MAG: hypothetical protein JXA06_04995 [Bacteroidetes bacterium]|nr:hypothetical protein [Bacteroidota bacterium]
MSYKALNSVFGGTSQTALNPAKKRRDVANSAQLEKLICQVLLKMKTPGQARPFFNSSFLNLNSSFLNLTSLVVGAGCRQKMAGCRTKRSIPPRSGGMSFSRFTTASLHLKS